MPSPFEAYLQDCRVPIKIVLSFSIHETQEPLNRFSLYLILGYFTKICQYIPNINKGHFT
jgi:hypothetical protein